MEPMTRTDAPLYDEDRFDAVRGQFEQVMAPAQEPVDVRAYLLDPPPTAEEAERAERRRQLVRRGSIVATVVIGLVLLAPWPRTGESRSSSPQAPHASTATTPSEPVGAVRVDADMPAAVPARQPRPRAGRQRMQRARAAPSSAAARSAPASAADTRSGAPAAPPTPPPSTTMTSPAAPAPAPVAPPGVDAGVLVPVA